MRKIIYKKWLDVIADYYSDDYPSKDKALNAAVANAISAMPWKDRRDALTENMIYQGAVESVKNGDYAVAFYDAYNDLKKVYYYYGEFNYSVYIKKGGGWRLKNGEPYVWQVYRHQIATALATYFKNEYVDKGKQFTVGDIDD